VSETQTTIQVQVPAFVTPPVISEAQMAALEAAGEFATYVSHIGGHGDVSIAEPINGRGGPRYEFDPARRVWRPIPRGRGGSYGAQN
jgi:hypothetical protein